jgi:hypothetical protein
MTSLKVRIAVGGVVALMLLGGLTALLAARGPTGFASAGGPTDPAEISCGTGPGYSSSSDEHSIVRPEWRGTCKLLGHAENGDPVYAFPIGFDEQGRAIYPSPDVLSSTMDASVSTSAGVAEGAAPLVTWHEESSYAYTTGSPLQWYYAYIPYPGSYTFSSAPNVALGEEYTNGDYGHIENSSSPDTARGVYTSYFWYRGQTNIAGRLGTEFIARGPQ